MTKKTSNGSKVTVVTVSSDRDASAKSNLWTEKYMATGSTMGRFCLMHSRADRAMRSIVTKQLHTYKLTMMEWLALAVMDGGGKKGLSMTQVAHELDVTLPQVTALVSILLELKLIRQKILGSDRRGRQVTITLKGKRTLVKLEEDVKFALVQWSDKIPNDRMMHYIKSIEQLSLNAG